jgi:hypothetical protein
MASDAPSAEAGDSSEEVLRLSAVSESDSQDASAAAACNSLSQGRIEFRFWMAIAVIMGPLLFLDFGATPVFHLMVLRPKSFALWLTFPVIGLIVAQGLILSLAQVLGPGTVLRRSLIAWAWGSAAYVSFMIGGLTIWPHPFTWTWTEFISGWCAFPLIVVTAGAPLWALQFATSCRLTLIGQEHEEPIARGTLFKAQLVLIAALGLASWGPQFEKAEDPLLRWVQTGLVCGAGMALCLLVTMPLLLAVLQWQSWRLALASIAVLMLVFAALFGIYSLSLPVAASWRGMLRVSLVPLSLAGGVSLQLWWLHQCGWRLTKPSRAARAQPAIRPT